MNKVSYVAMAFALVVPGMMFASSDSFSFGASNSSSSHQGGGMGAGKVSMQDMHMMREGSGSMMGSGHMDRDDMHHPSEDGSGSMMPRPPKPPMGSGAMMGSGMERDGKGLMLAIGALSPTDRQALMKLIRDYLVSKGIDLTKYAEKRDEMKDMKKDMHDEVKEMKKATREEIQKKRDQMKDEMSKLKASYDLKIMK